MDPAIHVHGVTTTIGLCVWVVKTAHGYCRRGSLFRRNEVAQRHAGVATVTQITVDRPIPAASRERMADKFWYLKKCNLFEQLPRERLKEVEARCRFRKFARNSPIYLPVDASDAVLMLASGRVKICSFTPEGKQSILAFVEPGEIFGELAMLEEGERRDEYAEAVDSSSVILIPADVMNALSEENPSVALGITKLIGLRRKRIERRLKYLLFHSNRDRLVHLLLELAEQYGETFTDGVELGIRLSHQELANIIGSTRETVTVVLGQLQLEKLIRYGRKKVVITDIESLAGSVQVVAPQVKSKVGEFSEESSSPSSSMKTFS